MYFTSLPDPKQPGFNEELHYRKFKKHNIIFSAKSTQSYCKQHVGCLSIKTILSGEEWYGINSHKVAVRPGQFLILNDRQSYSCEINAEKPVHTLSIFFKNSFASEVLRDLSCDEETMLDEPFSSPEKLPEFFQTLNPVSDAFRTMLHGLLNSLNKTGCSSNTEDEHLVFILRYMIAVQKSDSININNINAVKAATRSELYRRLCIARDVLHSSFMDGPSLELIGKTACMSVPQLVRNFKAVFHTTPHQYLTSIRLKHAAGLLKNNSLTLQEIVWACGFENVSSFCRLFKSAYGISPILSTKDTQS